MSALEWLSTVAGLALVGIALREVFQTLLHPSGVGQLTPMLFRGVWRLGRRLGDRWMSLAGPLAIVASIVLWAAGLIVGWALVYWPHLPEEFQVAQGIPVAQQGSPLDAMYVSGVALATLGFGDIVAEEPALRFATVLEALIGFGLLTASISWVLSIYPALLRRRALAGRIGTLLEGDGDAARLVPGDPPAALAVVLHGIADQLSATRVDFIQYPSSYFFHGPTAALALPAHVQRLGRAVRRDDLPQEARAAAAAVGHALDELATTLGSGPFGLRGDDDPLEGYAADHHPARG